MIHHSVARRPVWTPRRSDKLRLKASEHEPRVFGSSAEEHRAMSVEAVAKRLAPAPEGSFVAGAFHSDTLIGMAGFYRQDCLKNARPGNRQARHTGIPPCRRSGPVVRTQIPCRGISDRTARPFSARSLPTLERAFGGRRSLCCRTRSVRMQVSAGDQPLRASNDVSARPDAVSFELTCDTRKVPRETPRNALLSP